MPVLPVKMKRVSVFIARAVTRGARSLIPAGISSIGGLILSGWKNSLPIIVHQHPLFPFLNYRTLNNGDVRTGMEKSRSDRLFLGFAV